MDFLLQKGVLSPEECPFCNGGTRELLAGSVWGFRQLRGLSSPILHHRLGKITPGLGGGGSGTHWVHCEKDLSKHLCHLASVSPFL